MPSPHTLPIPPSLLTRACDAITRAVAPIPFVRTGIEVTQDLVAGTLEELNAEASRTLALSFRVAENGTVLVDGLDRHLSLRGFGSSGSAACIAGVLTEAGITMKASVADRRSHRFLRAVRLLPVWTWTIPTGSMNPESPGEMLYGDDATAGWTLLCPVCREGRLEHITGQQLYGIPGTDFFACTSCGAKYIPEPGKFRLVAIARRQDPLWSDLLNMAFTADEWQAIAQKGIIRKSRRIDQLPAEKAGKDVARTGQARREGAPLSLEIGNRTFYFTQVPLRFSKGNTSDLFQGRRDSVLDILQMPAFCHLREVTLAQYRNYIDLPIGFFLAGLKEKKQPFYRQFLHPFGDRPFCSFRAVESPTTSRCGVYIVSIRGVVQAAGTTVRPIRETIDSLLGTIPPAACYLDGDYGRCRINSVLCRERQHGQLFFYSGDDEEEIRQIGTELETRYSQSET